MTGAQRMSVRRTLERLLGDQPQKELIVQRLAEMNRYLEPANNDFSSAEFIGLRTQIADALAAAGRGLNERAYHEYRASFEESDTHAAGDHAEALVKALYAPARHSKNVPTAGSTGEEGSIHSDPTRIDHARKPVERSSRTAEERENHVDFLAEQGNMQELIDFITHEPDRNVTNAGLFNLLEADPLAANFTAAGRA